MFGQDKVELRALLKNKDYVAFWLSTTLSMAASNILQFCLALYVLAITGSATVFATTLSIIVIPRLLFSPVAGVLGDRHSRIKLMSVFTLASTVVLGLFSIISYYKSGLGLVEVYILVVMLEMVEVFYQAPASAIISELVEDSLLEEAISMSQVDDYVVYAIAPAVAAGIYKAYNITGAMVVATVCFLASFILRFFIKPKYECEREYKKSSVVSDFRSGVETINGLPQVKAFVLIMPLINLFLAGVFEVTVLYFLIEVLAVGETRLAIYKSITAIATMFTPLVVVGLVKNRKPIELISSIVVGAPICLALIALVAGVYGSWYVNPTVGLVLVTIIDCIIVTIMCPCNMAVQAAFQRDVPDEYRSRVLSPLGTFG